MGDGFKEPEKQLVESIPFAGSGSWIRDLLLPRGNIRKIRWEHKVVGANVLKRGFAVV